MLPYSAVFLLLFFLMGCISSTPSSSSNIQENQLPQWVNNLKDDGPLRAVGSSTLNFQGMYMQRSEAIADARDKLSHKIEVYISSLFESHLEKNGAHLEVQSAQTITEISDLLMEESYQIDGYIADDGRLYILVEVSDEMFAALIKRKGTPLLLPAIKTTPYDTQALEQSHCYDLQTLKSITTISGVYRNRPLWFYRPNQHGFIGSIGIAEKEEGISFQKQKQIGTSLAKSDLAKRQRLKVDSQHQMTKILKHNEIGLLMEKQVYARSISKIVQTKVKDIWMDPKNCELYVWIVKK